MRKIVAIIVISFFAFALNAQEKEKVETTFNVNMHCMSCVNKIEKNIAFEKGVKGISCNLEAKTVTVTYRADQTNTDNLIEGFAKIGYTGVTVKNSCKSDCSNACCADKNKCKKQDCTKKCGGS